MKKQYLKNNAYAETYTQDVMSSYQPEMITQEILEFSMGHMKIIEKSFYIDGLENVKKPYYYLSLHIVFKFHIHRDNIHLQNTSVSLLGLETGDEDIKEKQYKEYPITKKFSDYIKINLLKNLNNLKKIKTIEDKIYIVSSENIKEMKEGIKYIDEILKKEKEITIINDGSSFKFYKGETLKESLEIYKGGEVLRELEEIKQNLILQNTNKTEPIINKKITRKI